jgi:hypothetical protein
MRLLPHLFGITLLIDPGPEQQSKEDMITHYSPGMHITGRLPRSLFLAGSPRNRQLSLVISVLGGPHQDCSQMCGN